jgi:excisionase family DNA binding protein
VSEDGEGRRGQAGTLSVAPPVPPPPCGGRTPTPADKVQKGQKEMLRVLPELLLTVAQGAMQLGVNRETVYRLIKRGDLPAARVGSVLRISPADLAAYLRHS